MDSVNLQTAVANFEKRLACLYKLVDPELEKKYIDIFKNVYKAYNLPDEDIALRSAKISCLGFVFGHGSSRLVVNASWLSSLFIAEACMMRSGALAVRACLAARFCLRYLRISCRRFLPLQYSTIVQIALRTIMCFWDCIPSRLFSMAEMLLKSKAWLF